jgi:tetratricopeptide (TPR) repeat protein
MTSFYAGRGFKKTSEKSRRGTRMLWHDDLQSGKHLPAMIDLARKATALRPDIANNWYMLVSFLLQAGEDEEATAVLTEALSKLPSDPKLNGADALVPPVTVSERLWPMCRSGFPWTVTSEPGSWQSPIRGPHSFARLY